MEANTLSNLVSDLAFIRGELVLVLGVTTLLLVSFSRRISNHAFALTAMFLLLAAVFQAMDLRLEPEIRVQFFSGMLAIDPIASSFELLICVAGFLAVLVGRRDERAEYYMLILAATLGASFLTLGQHFAAVLLSLEILSIASYLLVAGTVADRHRAEAAWKFFIFGSTSTALMIFGMSYWYGATGQLLFMVGKNPVTATSLFAIGGSLTLAGFLFKMTVAPFHIWAPDAYEASPPSLLAFLSTVPKLGGLAIFVRVLHVLVDDTSTVDWHGVGSGLALASIVVGTLGALGQNEARRMMAYSSIAQAGFLLTAAVAFVGTGTHFDALWFYAGVFVLMNVLAFAVLAVLPSGTRYEDFAGLGARAPWAAFGLTVALISLVGLPPVAGFMAKILVFSALWELYQETSRGAYLTLFVAGLLAAVASLFFYLKIPFYMYFRKNSGDQVLKIHPFTNLLILILVIVLLALFFVPSQLMLWVNSSNFEP